MRTRLDVVWNHLARAPRGLVALAAVAVAASVGCAGETAEVRSRFVAARGQCTGDVQVAHRENPSSIPNDAPDREALRVRLASPKPGYDYYDVHGCGGGAVYECYDEAAYTESGVASRKVRHCSAMTEWTKVSAAAAAAAAAVQYEATDGSTRNARDDKATMVSRDAAIASATQDLPCDNPRVVGTDEDGRANAVEGCGLRVTYDLIPFQPEGPVEQIGAARGFRYKLKWRSSLATGPSPDGGQ